MLCSVCKTNAAVIFINRSNDANQMEGLCYECAKKKGINPLDALAKQANLSESDIENMSKQFETMFNDISENPDFAADGLMNDDSENSLGSIFSGLFGGTSGISNVDSEANNESEEAGSEETKSEEDES